MIPTMDSLYFDNKFILFFILGQSSLLWYLRTATFVTKRNYFWLYHKVCVCC